MNLFHSGRRVGERQSRRKTSQATPTSKAKKGTWSRTMGEMIKSRFFTTTTTTTTTTTDARRKKTKDVTTDDVTVHHHHHQAAALSGAQQQKTARRLPSVETERSGGSTRTCEDDFGQLLLLLFI